MSNLALALKIAKYGVVIIAAEDTTKDLSAVYTAGFSAIGLPELIMVGSDTLAVKTAALKGLVEHSKIYPRDIIGVIKTGKTFEYKNLADSTIWSLTPLANELAYTVATETVKHYPHIQLKFISVTNSTLNIEESTDETL
jgi:hypothetical protein